MCNTLLSPIQNAIKCQLMSTLLLLSHLPNIILSRLLCLQSLLKVELKLFLFLCCCSSPFNFFQLNSRGEREICPSKFRKSRREREFLSDPGIPGVWSIGPGVYLSVSTRPFWDFTDMTLADEDTNSILADNDNGAIQGNVAMQAAPSGGQVSGF